MPIVIAPINTLLTVVRIALDEKNKKHLQNLGLIEQTKIKVISSSGGNVIIEVKGVRLALNRDTATKIFVA